MKQAAIPQIAPHGRILLDETFALDLASYARLMIRDVSAKRVIVCGFGVEEVADRLRGGQVPEIACYDPANGDIAAVRQGKYDLVVAAMLERGPEPELDDFVRDIEGLSGNAVFFISTTFSQTVLEDGGNAHRTIREPDWWQAKLSKHFATIEPLPAVKRDTCSFATWHPYPQTLATLRKAVRRRDRGEKRRHRLAAPRKILDYLVNRFTNEAELFSALDGKRVALVGNSRALERGEWGGEIDSHDIIIRMNRAPIIHVRSHGSRTDWVAVACSMEPDLLRQRNPERLLWMTQRRKMPGWMFRRSELFVFSRKRRLALKRRIGKHPSTGFKVIDMLARSNCRAVTLYGFDFFATLSRSSPKNAAEVPHDFERERELIEALIKADPRFTLRR